MGFRDDNEALRARTKAAEQRAERAETERERMERELAEAKANDEADAKRIAELEARLAKLEPRSRARQKKAKAGRRKLAVMGVLVAVMLVPLVAGFLVYRNTSKKAEDIGASVAATAAEAPVAVPPPPEQPAQASPLERIRLAAVVRSADGVEELEAGDGCVADLGIAEGFSGLQVRCGAGEHVVTIYDGAASSPMGMIAVSDDAAEAVTIPGYVSRTMHYSRTGQWSGPQAQIQLDPDQHAARIWRQGIEARDVLLHLESSATGRGTPALSAGQSGEGTIARGTLAKLALRGDVPSVLGELDTDDCVLRTEPQPRSGSGALTARLVARCGERILYGAGRSGWVPAPADGEIIGPVEDTQMSAADTDPMMTFTGETLTLVEPEWRILFDIEPHPKCTLSEGTWVGVLRDESGLREGLSLTDGELTLPDGTVLMGNEDMRCHEGVARWATEEGTTMLEGRFGPSFATYLGRLATGELVELYRAD